MVDDGTAVNCVISSNNSLHITSYTDGHPDLRALAMIVRVSMSSPLPRRFDVLFGWHVESSHAHYGEAETGREMSDRVDNE